MFDLVPFAGPGRKMADRNRNGTADRLAVLASRVGEPPTERISVTREAGLGKSVGGKGRRRASFGLRDSPERQKWPVPWPVEAPSTASLCKPA